MNKTPAVRFIGFAEDWEQRKLGDLLQTLPFKQFLKEPEPDGKYEIIQQGNEPVIGFANGTPCGDYKDVVIFGDHTLSLYKPQHPFFVATDGVRIVKGQQDTDGYYLLSLLERYKPQSEGYKRYYSILADTNCITTYNTSEQEKIGVFFKLLDNLITLHQRKYDKLTNVKKSMLEKMFPQNGSNAPEIRFKGFTEAWEQRKVREVTDRYDNLRIPVAASLRVAGTTPYYGANGIQDYVDGYTHDGEFILVAEDGANDLKNYPVKCVKGRIWVNNHAHVLQGKYDCADNQFLAYAISQADIESLLVGGGRAKLNAETLMGIDLLLPNKAEQIRIGKYLAQLDNLITLHQREFAFLCKEKSKKFRYIKNAWEQRKFGEVFDCTVPNNTLSRAELSYDEGTVLNVHYGDVLIKYGSVLDVQKDDIPRIPHRCREDFNGALLQDGDVIIADTAEDETTGKACEIGNLQGSAIVSGLHTMVCRPRNRMALGYLGYYLNSNAYHYQLLPLMQGIKVLSLSRSNIQKTSVSYPSAMKEQQLIASYFSQLDHLITLHQRELEKLKNLKKACLEKMFV